MARPSGLTRAGWRSFVVCASGPSFSEWQAARIAAARPDWRVVVVNDNWRRVPSADVLYAADGRFWRAYLDAIRAGFAGELWTQDGPAASKFNLRCVEHRRKAGLTQTGYTVHGGGNSGYQAINLAYLLGAERIALVGFDMHAGPNGVQHWFGEHPAGKLRTKCPFSYWRERFVPLAADLAAAGVEVLNCTPGSALQCFPRADLATVLA